MNDARETILGRIREALSIPAQKPVTHDAASQQPSGPRSITDCLPFVGPTFEERLALFRKNAKELTADFRLCETEADLSAQLTQIAQAEGWKKIATHATDLTASATASLGLPVLQTDGGYNVNEMEQCDAGISACDALIAQTGSVLITSQSAGGRALSVLPPHHVVLARREQLVADLPAAFALIQAKYASNYPSLISFITGPSRTGDIERILVLGAHGPKKLTVLCV